MKNRMAVMAAACVVAMCACGTLQFDPVRMAQVVLLAGEARDILVESIAALKTLEEEEPSAEDDAAARQARMDAAQLRHDVAYLELERFRDLLMRYGQAGIDEAKALQPPPIE